MGLYRCKKCKTKKEFLKTTLIFFKNKIVSKEAKCCDTFMENIDKRFGIPTIILNDSALKNG